MHVAEVGKSGVQEHLELSVVDGLDDKPLVLRLVERRSALATCRRPAMDERHGLNERALRVQIHLAQRVEVHGAVGRALEGALAARREVAEVDGDIRLHL